MKHGFLPPKFEAAEIKQNQNIFQIQLIRKMNKWIYKWSLKLKVTLFCVFSFFLKIGGDVSSFLLCCSQFTSQLEEAVKEECGVCIPSFVHCKLWEFVLVVETVIWYPLCNIRLKPILCGIIKVITKQLFLFLYSQCRHLCLWTFL